MAIGYGEITVYVIFKNKYINLVYLRIFADELSCISFYEFKVIKYTPTLFT